MPGTTPPDLRRDKPAAPHTERAGLTDPIDAADQASLAHLLARPLDQRVREYKFRFAQSLVFGIPVVFLHYFGHLLGGPEARLWSALLQVPLAGWVMYTGAAGMLIEGLLLARRRITIDLLIAGASIAAYIYSAVATIAWLFTRRPGAPLLLFHASVILIICWTAAQWWRMSKQCDLPQRGARPKLAIDNQTPSGE